MRFPRKVRPFTGQLDVAAFLSVLFLLVLFLLLHSSLAPTPGVRIQLPTVAVAGPTSPNGLPLVLVLDQREQAYFERQAVTLEELRGQLTARTHATTEPVTLLVQADETVRHAALLRVSAVAMEAGVREVVVATRPPLFPTTNTARRSP